MKKKLLSIALVLVMILSLLPAVALAEGENVAIRTADGTEIPLQVYTGNVAAQFANKNVYVANVPDGTETVDVKLNYTGSLNRWDDDWETWSTEVNANEWYCNAPLNKLPFSSVAFPDIEDDGKHYIIGCQDAEFLWTDIVLIQVGAEEAPTPTERTLTIDDITVTYTSTAEATISQIGSWDYSSSGAPVYLLTLTDGSEISSMSIEHLPQYTPAYEIAGMRDWMSELGMNDAYPTKSAIDESVGLVKDSAFTQGADMYGDGYAYNLSTMTTATINNIPDSGIEGYMLCVYVRSGSSDVASPGIIVQYTTAAAAATERTLTVGDITITYNATSDGTISEIGTFAFNTAITGTVYLADLPVEALPTNAQKTGAMSTMIYGNTSAAYNIGNSGWPTEITELYLNDMTSAPGTIYQTMFLDHSTLTDESVLKSSNVNGFAFGFMSNNAGVMTMDIVVVQIAVEGTFITRIDTTELETLVSGCYWFNNTAKVGVNPSFEAVTAENTTAASWDAYAAALADAQEELAKLYDENGDPTDYNSAEGEAAANVAAAVTALNDAVAALEKLASADSLSDARIAYNSLVNLMKFYRPGRLSGYSADSAAEFEAAYEAAQTFLSDHAEPAEGIGSRSAYQYCLAYGAFWTGINKLTSDAETVSFTVHVTDSYDAHMEQDLSPLVGVYEGSLPAAEATVDGALSAVLGNLPLPADQRFKYAVYLNGMLLDPSIAFGAATFSGFSRTTHLRDGDILVLAMARIPYADGMLTPVRDTYRDIRYLQANDGAAVLEATADEVSPLTVTGSRAMPVLYTGVYTPQSGVTAFISDACATKEEAMRATVHDSGVVSGEDGSLDLPFHSAAGSSEGWYLVNLLDLSESGNLAGGANVLVHVTDPEDISAIKSDLKTRLNEIRNAYPDDFFTDDQLAEVRAAYADGLAAIDAAATSGDAHAAYETASSAILAIQSVNGPAAEQHLEDIRWCLEQLPNKEQLAAGKLYAMDKFVLDYLFGEDGLYVGLTNYEKGTLTVAEEAVLEALRTRYEETNSGADLPDTPAYTVTYRLVDENGDEITDIPPRTSQYGSRRIVFGPRNEIEYTAEGSLWYKNCMYYHQIGNFWSIAGQGVDTEPCGSASSEVVGNAGYGGFVVQFDFDYTSADWQAYGEWELESVTSNLPAEYNSKIITQEIKWLQSTLAPYAYQHDILVGMQVNPRQDVELVFHMITGKAAADGSSAADELTLAYNGYSASSYSDENWAELTAIYEAGLVSIAAADDPGAVKDDYISRMAAVPTNYTNVYGAVTVTFSNYTYEDGAFYDADSPFVSETVDLYDSDSAMTAALRALNEYEFTWNGGTKDYDISYLESIELGVDSLGQFDGGNGGGWMVMLNNWFVNESAASFSVADGRLKNGDTIEFVFTTDYGVDVRSGVQAITDTLMLNLSADKGTLSPDFDGAVTDYVLALDGDGPVVLTFEPQWRCFQARAYKGRYTPTAADYYSSGDTFYLSGGDVIYVAAGDPAWPSMSGNDGISLTPSVYTVKVVTPDSVAAVQAMINALPAVTYANFKTSASAVETARVSYDALGDNASGVDAARLLAAEQAIADFTVLDAFKAELAAVQADEAMAPAAGEAVVAAYDALNDTQKANLTRAEANKVEAIRALLQPAEPSAQVVSASLTLAGDIGVNYYVIPNDALLADEVAYAQFTVKGVEGEPIMLANLTPDNDGRYCFTQYVAAKEMVEQITLKLYTGVGCEVALTSASGKALESGAVYTVAKYVKSVSDATKPLAEKLASFGAYAQTYFAYEPVAPDEANADAIVGQDVSAVTVDDLGAYATTKDGAVTGVTVSGVSLTLDSLTTLNVTFTGKAVANCTVTVNGEPVKPVKSGSKYRVHIPNIAAKDLDEAYTIVVTSGDETLTLTASALSYARNTLRAYDGNEAKTALCDMVRALYEYSVEANAYFGA